MNIDQILHCGGSRGCGDREEGGLYACVATSPVGQPLELFVLDPARPFNGGAFRAPMFAERKDGYYDLIIWVGETSYPFVPDVLEEGRKMGFSRRVPSEGSFDLLTPFLSRLVLVHPKAVATPTPKLPESVWCRCKGESHACTFHLWPLSAQKDVLPKIEYRPGAFAALPLSHFEFINTESDEVPVKIAEKVHLAGYQIVVCKE